MEEAFGGIPEPLAGRLSVLDVLSRGTGGEVLRCHDRELDRVVILKVADEAWSDEAARRLSREAKMLAAIRHPGVLQVLGSGSFKGTHYMLVENLHGADLDDYVRARGPLPLDEALRVTATLARALAEVHAQDVLHRDLKPANVVMVPERGPVIIDFGLAMADDLTTITGPGDRMGTPAFMAPEQVLGEAATEQSDVYALGLILHFMLLGRNTMARGNVAEVMRAQIEEPPELLPGLAPPVAMLIDRLTAKVAADRPANALEVAAEVDALLGLGPSPARPAARRVDPPHGHAAARAGLARLRRGTAHRSVRPLPVAASVVLGALLLLAAAWQVRPAPVVAARPAVPGALGRAGRPGPGAQRLWCALPAAEAPWRVESPGAPLSVDAGTPGPGGESGAWLLGPGACLGDITLVAGPVRARVSGALALLEEIGRQLRMPGADAATEVAVLLPLLPLIEEALGDPAVPLERRWALYTRIDDLPEPARLATLLERFVPASAGALAREVVPPEGALLADAHGAPLDVDGDGRARRVTVIGGSRAAREPFWIALEVSGLAPGAAVTVRLDAERAVHLRGPEQVSGAVLVRARLPAGTLRPGDNALALGWRGPGPAPRLGRAWAWAGEAR